MQKKIRLNFKAVTEEVIDQTAQNTLEPVIEEQKRIEQEIWENPDIGEVMPDTTVYAGRTDSGQNMFCAPKDTSNWTGWKDGLKEIRKLNEKKYLGHDDWRLPSRGELLGLFNNKAQIGGFRNEKDTDHAWYWTGEKDGWFHAYTRNFTNGQELCDVNGNSLNMRIVRSMP